MEFNVADSLGSLPPAAIAKYLREIGDTKGAGVMAAGGAARAQNILRPRAPYTITSSQLGFIAPVAGESTAAIVGATVIDADPTLIGTQIKISFDAAYIYEYPGFGKHQILCEFVGKNQIRGETEALRMALRFSSTDKAKASVLGVPIFLGLTVGPNGIAFEGRSVNVKSDGDETLLEVLDTAAFKSGLSLVSSVQPGLKPLVGLVQGAVKMVASRSSNCQVHNYNLGLDFASTSTSARLRCGSYVVAQVNDEEWNWDDFEWDRGSDALRRKKTRGDKAIDFNYMVISVSPYTHVVTAKAAPEKAAATKLPSAKSPAAKQARATKAASA